MAAKKKSKWNEQTQIRGALRRIFSRSPVVREVLQKHRRTMPRINKDGSRAKRDAVEYQCMACKQWVPSGDIQVDHVTPVISVEDGFQDWNTFVARLFCDTANLEPLCGACHHAKTQSERKARAEKKKTPPSHEAEWRESTMQSEELCSTS